MMQPSLCTGTAERLARAALASITRDYPNKLDHVMTSDADARPPRDLHPSFHGSYDWHSCVHMHWTLARLLRRVPALTMRDEIASTFERHFSPAAIAAELAYLARPASESFERTYGWAWLMRLAAELEASGGEHFARWSMAVGPLARAFASRLLDFLPRAHYPLRYGLHSNSAFALTLALDYARVAGDDALADACTGQAMRWFARDIDAPAQWEPSGVDFLSPSLVEAALIGKLVDASAFGEWLTRFLPGFAGNEPASLFVPALVTERTDPQLVHLDGLNLSRAWCFRGIADALPANDPRAAVARHAGERHLAAGWQGLESDAFVGAHWLATFALLALDGS